MGPSRFLFDGIFSTDFRKKSQISNFFKTSPLGADLFHADRRTDLTKLIVAFRNFARAPRNEQEEDGRRKEPEIEVRGCRGSREV